MIDMCYAAGQVSYNISGAQGVGLHTLMHGCRGRGWQESGKFSKTAKLEIQKLENLKFNKSGNSTKTGKLDIQQIRIYHKNQQNRNPMKLHFRCPEEQEFRKTVVCPSGTLPPDIPRIWNGRFCTLIDAWMQKWVKISSLYTSDLYITGLVSALGEY